MYGRVGVVARPAYSALGGEMPPLEVVEIRTLDGANIYLPEPAIKVQVRVGALSEAELAAAQARRNGLLAAIATPLDRLPGLDSGPTVGHRLLRPSVRQLHRALGLMYPVMAVDFDYRELREPAGV